LDGRLQGKVAVVTAAAGVGIGGSIVRRFIDEGATVLASDSHAGRAERLAADLGVDVPVVNVGDREAFDAYLDGVLDRHGRVDVLVNCAGTNAMGPIHEIDDESWDRVINVNLTAAFRAVRMVLPGMIDRGDGVIVNIGSIAGYFPEHGEVAYSTSKAALMAFTRAVANEVASSGVRVNSVAPGFVQNPFLENLYGPERMAELVAAAPLGRGVQPEEIAAAVSWLASSEALCVTGETLTIAAGQYFRA